MLIFSEVTFSLDSFYVSAFLEVGKGTKPSFLVLQ